MNDIEKCINQIVDVRLIIQLCTLLIRLMLLFKFYRIPVNFFMKFSFCSASSSIQQSFLADSISKSGIFSLYQAAIAYLQCLFLAQQVNCFFIAFSIPNQCFLWYYSIYLIFFKLFSSFSSYAFSSYKSVIYFLQNSVCSKYSLALFFFASLFLSHSDLSASFSIFVISSSSFKTYFRWSNFSNSFASLIVQFFNVYIPCSNYFLLSSSLLSISSLIFSSPACKIIGFDPDLNFFYKNLQYSFKNVSCFWLSDSILFNQLSRLSRAFLSFLEFLSMILFFVSSSSNYNSNSFYLIRSC